eukprot:GHRQ01031471.1.p1 GENE.GHRQ01031471.1~~GHRQ01031471.1.p1  ORF type:complete len:210 (-),score=15.92 GHRQ01031471.1:55-684(-)
MVLTATQTIPADAPLLLSYFVGSNDEFLLHYGECSAEDAATPRVTWEAGARQGADAALLACIRSGANTMRRSGAARLAARGGHVQARMRISVWLVRGCVTPVCLLLRRERTVLLVCCCMCCRLCAPEQPLRHRAAVQQHNRGTGAPLAAGPGPGGWVGSRRSCKQYARWCMRCSKQVVTILPIRLQPTQLQRSALRQPPVASTTCHTIV